MFESKQNFALAGVFLSIIGLAVWFQFSLSETPIEEMTEEEKNEADYYVENFTSTGMDEFGKQYELQADRMVHYPIGDRALLDNPHIVQYDLNDVPRHIYADSGWLYNETSKILLTGNVKVIEGQNSTAGGISMGEKMIIILNEKRG